MQIISGARQLPDALRGGVLTIGNFDGVHRGHQIILAQVTARALSLNVPAVAMTFDPHPAKLLAPERPLRLIQTTAQRLRALAAWQLTATILEPFTSEFARITAPEFCDEMLATRFVPREIIVGYDFTFGRHRAGRTATLTAWGERAGCAVTIVEPIFVGETLVSSSLIRDCIARGELVAAHTALGRPFALEGHVVSGEGVGRQLGFPTLNMEQHGELLPPEGIYITSARFDEDTALLPSVSYLGRKPTFGGVTPVIETHLLVPLPATPSRLEIFFHQGLRADQAFISTEELQSQIARDVAAARHYHGL